MGAEDLRQFAHLDAAAKLRIGDSLREQARALRPDWPDEAEREADLAHHIRLSELLRSVVLPRTD